MVKNLPAKAGDMGSIPGSERSPREEDGNPFQYSCLENPTDRGAWWAAVHGVTESDMTEHTADEAPRSVAACGSAPLPRVGSRGFIRAPQYSQLDNFEATLVSVVHHSFSSY